jgi:hypothetical protein
MTRGWTESPVVRTQLLERNADDDVARMTTRAGKSEDNDG